MKNRTDTATSTSPTSPDLDSLPPIRSRTRARVPAGWPNGEPAGVRAAYDAAHPQKRGA